MAVFTYLATTAFWAGVTSAIGVTAANVAIAIGQAAAWALASAALNKPEVSRQQVMATVDETDAPRVRAYGYNLLGGVRAFFEARDGRLYQIVVVHHGRVDGLIDVWLDGEKVNRNTTTGEIQRYKYVHFRDGSAQGGDYDDVRAVFPTLWTTAHRLQNQATFQSTWGDPSDEDFSKVFPKGAQTQVQLEIRGLRVKNLRDGTAQFSDSAGWCIYHFMTDVHGWGLPEEVLDLDIWRDFSAIGQEVVQLAGGGSERRYRLSGYYTLEDPLRDVTARMLATCDGQIYETAEGKVGILGGKWSVPDVTITAADILSLKMEDVDPFTAYNVLQGKYVSPEHGYQPTEVQERVNASLLATQGRRVDMLDVDMCPSGTQLQRLMKIREAKNNREVRGIMTTTRVGMKARFPKGDGVHTINISSPEDGLSGPYEVLSHRFFTDGTCEIGFGSLADPYPWSPSAEETTLPPTLASLSGPGANVPVPANPVLVQEREIISGDVQAVKLSLSVNDPERDGLELWAQIAVGDVPVNNIGAFGRFVDMQGSQVSAESGILADGQTYTVRYRWRGYGSWNKAGPVTVIANPVLPPAPTSFDAMVVGGNAYLDWINAPARYYRTQILMGTTTNVADAVVVATIAGQQGRSDSATLDMTGVTGTRRFWVRTLNASRIPSDPVGPQTLTF